KVHNHSKARCEQQEPKEYRHHTFASELLHVQRMLEQRSWNIDARSFQSIRELWANSRSRKVPYYATLRNPLLLEQENVLHAYRVFFPAGDFGQMGYSS